MTEGLKEVKDEEKKGEEDDDDDDFLDEYGNIKPKGGNSNLKVGQISEMGKVAALIGLEGVEVELQFSYRMRYVCQLRKERVKDEGK